MPLELDEALREIGDALRRVTVQVRAATGRGGAGGAGVVWREDGLVVTNAHVARGPRAVVQLHDGRSFPARRIAVDPVRDLAALRLDATGLEAARSRPAAGLRPGDVVVALGHPLGWIGAFGFGVVHGVDRFRGAPRWIRADIRLAPGNSGGPLADATGAVVGLNAMVVGGLGLAVPAEAVQRLLAPPAARPLLGVALRAALARAPAGDTAAFLVTAVRQGGAAARADVRPGDAVLGIDGHAFAGEIDLVVALEGARPDDIVTLEIVRAGRGLRREVRLQAEPALEVAVA